MKVLLVVYGLGLHSLVKSNCQRSLRETLGASWSFILQIVSNPSDRFPFDTVINISCFRKPNIACFSNMTFIWYKTGTHGQGITTISIYVEGLLFGFREVRCLVAFQGSSTELGYGNVVPYTWVITTEYTACTHRCWFIIEWYPGITIFGEGLFWWLRNTDVEQTSFNEYCCVHNWCLNAHAHIPGMVRVWVPYYHSLLFTAPR